MPTDPMSPVIWLLLGVAIVVAGALHDNAWTPMIGGGLIGFALSELWGW